MISGGEVLGADGIEKVTELPDQFVGIGTLLTLVVFVDGQHDPFGIHQLIDNEQGGSGPDSHGHRVRGPRRDRDLMTVVAKHNFLSLIHISEPTRRTPISYAVFCLKKKK